MGIWTFVARAALCALVALGIGAAQGSAASYWHDGSATGAVLPSGTALMSGAGDGAILALSAPQRILACTSNTVGFTVGASSGSSTTATLDAMTWQSCSETFFPIDVNNCQAVAPFPTGTAVAGASGGTVTWTNLKLRCAQQSTTTACYYLAGSVVTTYTNATAKLAPDNGFAFTHTTGASDDLGNTTCGTAGSGTFGFTDLTTTATHTTAVFNNENVSYLHAGTASTNVISSGSTIQSGTSDGGTLTLSGLGTATCTGGAFDFTVGMSGTSSIDGTLDVFDLTGCSDTIPVIDLAGCQLSSPTPTVDITATGSTGGTMSFSGLFLRCGLSGNPNACYYQAATASGTYTNTGAKLTFTNSAIVHDATGVLDDVGALCGTSGTLSATFTDVTDAGAPTVILNQNP